jgi:AcrR family transcriptional regulator
MVRKLDPEKKAKLLHSALTLFVEHGVQQTSTAAISKAAGMAAGTLFLYFPSKQDLIHELILNIGREQSEYINSLLDPALDARETFLTIWNGSIQWFLDHPDSFRYVLHVRNANIISEAVARESEKFFSYYFLAIQKGLAEGRIKPYPLELIGAILYHDTVAILDTLGAQPDPGKRRESIRLGFEIFWNGIRSDRSGEAPA